MVVLLSTGEFGCLLQSYQGQVTPKEGSYHLVPIEQSETSNKINGHFYFEWRLNVQATLLQNVSASNIQSYCLFLPLIVLQSNKTSFSRCGIYTYITSPWEEVQQNKSRGLPPIV